MTLIEKLEAATGPDTERDRIIAWLRRRGDMCLPYPPIWKPLRRLKIIAMRPTVLGAAQLISRGVHEAASLEEETSIMRAALQGERVK